MIITIHNVSPRWGNNCFIAPNATLIGDVVLGDECSVWFNTVVRGDVHQIRIGNRVNIQDHAIIHCSYQKAAVYIGNGVSIGHRAIVHGCTLHDHVLIGMGAIVMDNALVESGSIVAAGAVVLENTHIEANCIYAGIPARKVKQIDAEQTAAHIKRLADNYMLYASWYNLP